MTPAASGRPLVSVVIPNYNYGHHVGAAIESVLGQTYAPIEVIVVDNGSTDLSWDVIRAYADRGVRAFQFTNDGVVAGVRNYGIAQSSGELTAFLDSDDTWKLHKLERQVPEFADPSVVLVSASSLFIGDIDRVRRDAHFRPGQRSREFCYDQLVLDYPISTSSVVVRAGALRSLHGFDESRHFRFIEDWELWLRLSRMGRVRVLAEPLITYRLDVNKDRDARDVTRRKLLVLEKHRRLGYLGDKVYEEATGNVLVELGRACLGVGDRTGIRHYVRGIVKCGGVQRRLSALVGLLLFGLPGQARRAVIDAMYRVQYAVGRMQSR